MIRGAWIRSTGPGSKQIQGHFGSPKELQRSLESSRQVPTRQREGSNQHGVQANEQLWSMGEDQEIRYGTRKTMCQAQVGDGHQEVRKVPRASSGMWVLSDTGDRFHRGSFTSH